MSSVEWLGELKCLEMLLWGSFLCCSLRWVLFLTLRKCSPNLLFSWREVSPMYNMLHWVHETQ